MIIGISGKKQHGKDTVASIIQYLFWNPNGLPNPKINSFEEWQTIPLDFKCINSKWQRKQFAGKLKEIVCLLIGCTMEQLEDNNFKEKELSEEWRVWYVSFYKFKSDTNPTGRTSKLFITKEEAENSMDSMVKAREIFGSEGLSIETYILTPRLLLQYIGTTSGRDIIHPNIWVNATMADYIMKSHSDITRDLKYPNWIITDCRFPNEVKAIKDRGGIVIRVDRPIEHLAKAIVTDNNDGTLTYSANKQAFAIDLHPSETALDNYDGWDAYIINNQDIDTLISKVKDILIQFKLL